MIETRAGRSRSGGKIRYEYRTYLRIRTIRIPTLITRELRVDEFELQLCASAAIADLIIPFDLLV